METLPHSQKAGVQHKPHCTKNLGTVSHSDLEMVETRPKSKFPDASQDQADLSKENSLKTTPMGTLIIFPISQEKQTEGKEVQ